MCKWLKEEDSFHQQTGLKFKEETSKVLHLEHSFVWCWNLYTSETGSEIPGKFSNVVLEKNGEDQLDRSCEKWRSITQSQGGEEYPTYNKKKRKANWIGHILRRNCLLKHVIEGQLEGRIEMTGRRGRRRKQLLDDLKENRRYCKFKEEALDRTLWRTRFGRGYGPVVRQTTEWMRMKWLKKQPLSLISLYNESKAIPLHVWTGP
jgi:hypothetical protein